MIENAKNRVSDVVNNVLFSKSVSNKFITGQNLVINIFLICRVISELLLQYRLDPGVESRSKTLKKRVLHAVNGFYLVKRQATNAKLCKILLLFCY